MSWASAHARRKRKRLPENDLPIQIEWAGECIEVRVGKAWEPQPAQAAGRTIQGFSSSARLRMTKSLARLDIEKTPISVAITLTYPDECLPRDKDRRATDLYLMIRYIEKYLGKHVSGIWRCEWERRKDGSLEGMACPHFHLILFGITFIHYTKINAWWKQVLNYSNYVRTEIKRAGSKKKTLRYIAKYIKKRGEASLVYAPNSNSIDGKHYGWHRRKALPTCEPEWISEPSEAALEYLFRKHHERMAHSDTRVGESFSILGKGCGEIMEIVRGLCLTSNTP